MRVYNGYKLHLHSQISAKGSDHSTGELSSIVGDDSFEKPIHAHNFLPIEMENSLSCDFNNNFLLYPFGEIIDSHYQEFHLS